MTIPTFHRFSDLKARNIVNSWASLQNRIKNHGFPPGRLIAPNVRAWTDEEINEYLASRPVKPKLTPAVKGHVKGRGRPRKATAEAGAS